MARGSNSGAARTLPLPNVYTFNVMVSEESMTALGHACAQCEIQAHRSILPIGDQDDLYSVQLQVSACSQADALVAVFNLGSAYGVKSTYVKV